MIFVRSPLRISLGGGGTDLSSYYSNFEGFLVAAAINKYVYVTITRPFTPGIYLKYSEIEKVQNVNEINHKIIKEALNIQNYSHPQIEITTLTDIPAGTGLGSSGSFTTALLKGLSVYNKVSHSQKEIAEGACDIEINRLNQPIGKQDQYIASFGGISSFTFCKDESVVTSSLNLNSNTIHKLEDNLLLFFTGFSRSASTILKDQNDKSKTNDNEMIKNLHYVKEIGYESKKALESDNLEKFGELMHDHWLNKKKRSRGMSNNKIDTWYDAGINAGAIGGKVVGAGGGGFLMFYTNEPERLRKAMREFSLEEVRFKFDFEGTKVIFS